MDKGMQAGQCDEVWNGCFPACGPAVCSRQCELKPWRGLSWVLRPQPCSGEYCCCFCPSGPMLKETFPLRMLGIPWETVSSQGISFCLLLFQDTHLWSRAIAFGTERHFSLTGRKMAFSCTTSPQVFIVLKVRWQDIIMSCSSLWRLLLLSGGFYLSS